LTILQRSIRKDTPKGFSLQIHRYSLLKIPQYGSAMKKILLLDDNQDILEIVEEVLSYEKFDVLSARDDANIMTIAEEFKPDLILTDYRLGNANGGELCLQFKAHPELGKKPVVIFSAYVHKNTDFSKYGCDAVIEKPFDLENLTQTIGRLIDTPN